MCACWFVVQISEPEIGQFCKEAQSYLIDGRYPDLVNLLLTSADQVLKKTSEKGIIEDFLGL